GLLDELRSRRSLRDERERTVLVDGDLDGDDVATLGFCRGVVRLAELHDVDAVLTKRGADRGCRVSGSRLDLQLDQTGDLLLGRHVRSLLFSSSTRATLARAGSDRPLRCGAQSNSTSIPRPNARRRIPVGKRT